MPKNVKIDEPSAFVCPITYDIMSDPVQGPDGHSYERQAIVDWLSKHGTSPLTRKPMTAKELVENRNLKDLIEAWKEEQQQAKDKQANLDESKSPPNVEDIHSLSQLDRVFTVLDPLRDVLKQLDPEPGKDWSPPQIVVMGNESSGKSTILERIAMMPLFPVGENICTRLPIEVRLRHGPAKPPVLSVLDLTTAPATVESSVTIAAENAQEGVARAMQRAIEQEHANSLGVTNKRRILLEVQRMDLPNIDLLDLPGLVSSPDAKMKAHRRVAEENIERVGDCALFVLCAPATAALNMSNAFNLVQKYKLEERSMGVITFADEVPKKKFGKVLSRLAQTSPETDIRLKHGYVVTMNDPDVKLSLGKSNSPRFARLKSLAQEELRWFRSEGHGELLDQGTAGGNALVHKLEQMYHSYLNGTWATLTFEKLQLAEQNLDDKIAALGLPIALEPVEKAVRKKIARAACAAIKSPNMSILQHARAMLRRLAGSNSQDIDKLKDATTALKQAIKDSVDALASDLLKLPPTCTQPLREDTRKIKLGRFPGLIREIEQFLSDWLKEKVLEATNAATARVERVFEQVPNGVYSVEFDDEFTGANITLSQSYAGTVIQPFAELVVDFRKMFQTIDHAKFVGSVAEENCKEERLKLQSALATLTNARLRILELLGISWKDFERRKGDKPAKQAGGKKGKKGIKSWFEQALLKEALEGLDDFDLDGLDESEEDDSEEDDSEEDDSEEDDREGDAALRDFRKEMLG